MAKSEFFRSESNFWIGLPGKVAPVSAAGAIKDTVYNIIEEMGDINGSKRT